MTEPGEWEGGQPRRRVVPLALLVVAALGGGGLLAGSGGVAPAPAGLTIEEAPGPPPAPAPDAPEAPELVVQPQLSGSWEATAAGPLAGRAGATTVWTGEEVLVWGGAGAERHRDGALYHPDGQAWRRVSPSPLKARIGAAGVWSGSEALILGGRVFTEGGDGGPATRPASDGAAYNPATDTWRRLPRLPFPTAAGRVFAAGGRVYAVAFAADEDATVVVLDTGAAAWRVVATGAALPHGERLAAANAGNLLFIWPEGRGRATAVDLTDGRETLIAHVPPPASLRGCGCRLYGGAVAGASAEVVGFDSDRGTWWRHDPGVPTSQIVSTPDLLLVVAPPGPTQAIERRTGRLLAVPGPPFSLGFDPNTTLAGDRLFAWGGFRTLRRIYTGDGLLFKPVSLPRFPRERRVF